MQDSASPHTAIKEIIYTMQTLKDKVILEIGSVSQCSYVYMDKAESAAYWYPASFSLECPQSYPTLTFNIQFNCNIPVCLKQTLEGFF